MIPIEKLKAVSTIVCHGPGCADGLASAMLLQDVLEGVVIEFCQYGKQQRELDIRPGMLFCDFSPDAERLSEWVEAGTIVLDHHKWTREVVEAFGDLGVFADEETMPGVSGAVLAYREVWEPIFDGLHDDDLHDDDAPYDVRNRAQRFAALAGVYDTWQTKDKRWLAGRVQERALRTFGLSLLEQQFPFSSASDPMEWWADKLAVGKALIEKMDSEVKGALRSAYRYNTSEGTRVVMFEGTSLTSIAAEVVGSAADLIVGFGYKIEDDNALMIITTRSHTGYNCMKLCAEFGGGGHTAAAAFSSAWKVTDGSQDPYTVVKAFVQQHETSWSSPSSPKS